MLNILLIEDDEVDAESVERTLSRCQLYDENGKCSANIIHVDYFEKGLNILEKNKEVDIILLDLHLPDGQGAELVRTLHEKYYQVPVVVLTGQNQSDTLGAELVREGAEDYMPKSDINEASLSRCIQYSINRHQLSNKVKTQTIALKNANEELETFTYIASHDLRSPLVNLKGFSTELKRSIDTLLPIFEETLAALDKEKQQIVRKECEQRIPKSIEFIRHSADKMDRLTHAILQLSRLGRRELSSETIATSQLVEKCINALQHQIDATKIKVSVEPLPDITGDPHSIEQIFGNLLDNAIKYLDPDRPGDIRISAKQGRAHTTFSVEDNGRGIAQDDMHKVFEIFRRAGNVDQIAGEGMGMPYVRALVKRHGGNIWCESEPEKGTTFHFTIANSMGKSAAA